MKRGCRRKTYHLEPTPGQASSMGPTETSPSKPSWKNLNMILLINVVLVIDYMIIFVYKSRTQLIVWFFMNISLYTSNDNFVWILVKWDFLTPNPKSIKFKFLSGENIPNAYYTWNVCGMYLCRSCFALYDHLKGGREYNPIIYFPRSFMSYCHVY